MGGEDACTESNSSIDSRPSSWYCSCSSSGSCSIALPLPLSNLGIGTGRGLRSGDSARSSSNTPACWICGGEIGIEGNVDDRFGAGGGRGLLTGVLGGCGLGSGGFCAPNKPSAS